MFGEISLVLQDIIVAIVIFLTSFLPSNPEKLTLDASAVTAQSVEMVFEVKNETGRVIDQPTVAQISRKTDEGWDVFYSNDVIYDENDYVLPGGTEAFRISGFSITATVPSRSPATCRICAAFSVCPPCWRPWSCGRQVLQIPFWCWVTPVWRHFRKR